MTTFTILKQDLIDLTEDNSSEFATESLQFIATTELRLSRELQNCPALQKHVTSTLTVSDPFVTKPSDYVSSISFQVLSSAAARNPLEYRDVSYINEYWPTRTSTSTPKYYADWNDGFFLIAPTPSAALNLELNYRSRFDALSNDTATNWLTDNAYDALLYGALIEAAVYNKNPAQQQVYQQRYQEAIASVNDELVLKRGDNFTR
tara:strand:- start:151 stop:765 length:615 start_codon:yes stop_codon:yes gene_type:complete